VVKAVLDTNILIDFLRGLPQARAEMDMYTLRAISVVTWIEVLVGAEPTALAKTLAFLEKFEVIPLDETVAMRAASIRRQHRVKLPDAIVWASADVGSLLLVTRNTKDFPAGTPRVRHPYSL